MIVGLAIGAASNLAVCVAFLDWGIDLIIICSLYTSLKLPLRLFVDASSGCTSSVGRLEVLLVCCPLILC